MSTTIILVFAVFFVLRLSTLFISVKNEKRLKHSGAQEYGKLNSAILAILHFIFYVSPLRRAISMLSNSAGQQLSALFFTFFLWRRFFKQIIGLLVFAYIFLLPGYRAKLASDAYGDCDMEFWEAHRVSGAILKIELSSLPIIGKFF